MVRLEKTGVACPCVDSCDSPASDEITAKEEEKVKNAEVATMATFATWSQASNAGT